MIWRPFPVGCEGATIRSLWMKWGQARTGSGLKAVLGRWGVRVTEGSVMGWSVCEVKAGVRGSVTREREGSAVVDQG